MARRQHPAAEKLTTGDWQPDQQRIAGRKQEIRQLEQLLQRTLTGDGAVAIVSGEAGIGKTTLVGRLAEQARQSGAITLAGHCYDLETTPPFGPWLEINQFYAASLPQSEPGEVFSAQPLQDSSGSAAEFFEALRNVYVDIASKTPLVMIFEDLHWADSASLEFLRYFSRKISQQPILIVVTYRDSELTAGHPLSETLPLLVRESPVVRIPLQPLDADATRELISGRYQLASEDRQRLMDYLQKYAEGNPFYIEELLIALEYQHTLRQAEPMERGNWALGSLTDVQMPLLVRQVISKSTEHLDPSAQRMLQAASVIGVEVPLDLWRDVVEISEEELADAIEDAANARLFIDIGEPDRLRFRHALIRESFYTDLVLPRRQTWHRRIGETLATRPNPDPDLIAYHFRQAGDDQQAVDWLVKAGHRATRTFAYQIAARRFQQALEILERHGGQLQKRGWLLCYVAESYRYGETRLALSYVTRAWELLGSVDDPALRAVVLRTRSHIRGMLGENALEEIDEAIAAYEALSETDRQRILASPVGYTATKSTHAQRLAYYGQYRKARDLAFEFLDEERQETREYCDIAGIAWLCIGMASAGMGEPESARTAYAQARDNFARAGNSYQTGLAYTWEYTTVLHVFYPELVEERRRYIQLAEEAFKASVYVDIAGDEQPLLLFVARMLDGSWDETLNVALPLLDTDSMSIESAAVVAEIYLWRGQYQQAQTLIDRTLPEGRFFGPSTPYYRETMDLQRIAAELALEQHQPVQARQWIDIHRKWVEWDSLATGRATIELLEARLAALNGDLGASHDHALKALTLAREPGEPLAELAALRMFGAQTASEGDFAEARQYLDRAMILAAAIASPYQASLTQLEVARLELLSGQLDIAADLLNQVRETASHLKAIPLLRQAESLGEEASDLPAPAPDTAGLSPRQLEVLQLIAEGQTDREIAEQLFISPRTVMNHVSAILNKLGVNSRAAAAAIAVRNKLV